MTSPKEVDESEVKLSFLGARQVLKGENFTTFYIKVILEAFNKQSMFFD